MTRQARHRTVIAQKERQIGKLRDEVERLRKILLERDTGTGENRETVLPKNRNNERTTYRKTEITKSISVPGIHEGTTLAEEMVEDVLQPLIPS